MSKKSQENLEEHKGQTCSAYIKTYCKAVVIKAERNWPKGKNTPKEQNQEPRNKSMLIGSTNARQRGHEHTMGKGWCLQ